MDKRQARNIIAKVTGMVEMVRADHENVVKALELLKPEQPKEDKEES